MSGPGIPPQLEAMLSGGADSLPQGAPPGMEDPSAGAAALQQSEIAKQGLAAWKQVQNLNGQRPEGDLVKALIMYVLTEGQAAPMAKDISAYLQSLGVQIPGVGVDNSVPPPGIMQAPQPDTDGDNQ